MQEPPHKFKLFNHFGLFKKSKHVINKTAKVAAEYASTPHGSTNFGGQQFKLTGANVELHPTKRVKSPSRTFFSLFHQTNNVYIGLTVPVNGTTNVNKSSNPFKQFGKKFKETTKLIHNRNLSRPQFRDILLSDRLTPLSHLNTYKKKKNVTPPQFGTINTALNKNYSNSLSIAKQHKPLDGPQL